MIHLIKTLPVHIAKRIEPDPLTGCWNYVGNDPTPNGYQRAWFKGIRSVTHRIVYIFLVGGNIEKRELDHECCNRACCNPEHLSPVTPKRNCQLRNKRMKSNFHAIETRKQRIC
jgi:hypothetical protein